MNVPAFSYSSAGLMPVETNFMNAARLARKVMDAWHERGYPQVEAWVEKGPVTTWGTIYEIKSNLINGCPPGA